EVHEGHDLPERAITSVSAASAATARPEKRGDSPSDRSSPYISSWPSALLVAWAVMRSVSTSPGHSEITAMPRDASSRAASWVILSMPALPMQYGTERM